MKRVLHTTEQEVNWPSRLERDVEDIFERYPDLACIEIMYDTGTKVHYTR